LKKLLLLLIVLGIGLYNYKLISFDGGFRIASFKSSPNTSLITQIAYISDINNIYYYNHPFGKDYLVVVDSPTQGLRIHEANEQEIENLKLSGMLFENLKPQKITTIPIYVYGILLFIILAYTSRRRRYHY